VRGAARFLRRLAVVAVLLGLTAPSFAPGHSLTETDRDCGPVLFGARHAAAVFSAVQATSSEEHCAFCHWHRAFGNANPMAVAAIVPRFDRTLSIAAPDDRGCGSDVVGLRPARAPPSLDLL
jgi:hypothetical protein